ncbi:MULTISPECIES: DUF2333 family protein [unclassified Anaerobiospirillum]|uniref:DUF2333 family protein n=1 Tax=unclassified Anaerobiospirillum TaxID=2647410 RepID=UPI001FF0FC17|nr:MULTISPECIES: DUF2333 family protein [unclassified Anaerobiospirillum]MCK0534759.1 DUF2333 family protein [Anaerobiospirillum sp. NML120511]MCK0539461.1 DUF2333 family protein [Anaerobiospirillum sp. NML02-A-032]
MDKIKTVRYGLGGIAGLVLLWIVAVGLFSTAGSKPFNPEPVDGTATEQQRATIIAQGLTWALDQELSSFFGFLPNDLISPWVIDNTTNYQRGVIYATRPASDVIAKEVARYGNRDTIDQRLADATSRYFSYSENAWGFLFVYDAEGKYRQGIKNWADWAASVGTDAKNAGVYNMKSDDVYSIVKYAIHMTDFALGMLNDNNIGHFNSDNNIYFAKGVCAVTGNLFRALLAVDGTVAERGGAENVQEALKRFEYIEEFDPLYITAGGNKVGDAMMPNHVAALARHIDIANNRLTDILSALAR